MTAAPYDGWTENLFAPGQHATSDYPMDQRAALLWYHDHVMGVTQLTVYAGLAGLWILRDQRERALDLPEGPPFEVPLLLQDRNFGLGADRRLTGALVHKTDPATMEAFAFEDAATFFPMLGGWEVWQLLNLSGDTHPIHLHLEPLGTGPVVARRRGDPEASATRWRRPRRAAQSGHSAGP